MSETIALNGLAQAIFAGGLAFAGVATGGIALAWTAFLNMRHAGQIRISQALKAVLISLTTGLFFSIVAAGLAFAYLPKASPYPPLLWLASAAIWMTLTAALVASIVLIVAVLRLP